MGMDFQEERGETRKADAVTSDAQIQLRSHGCTAPHTQPHVQRRLAETCSIPFIRGQRQQEDREHFRSQHLQTNLRQQTVKYFLFCHAIVQ